MLARYIFFYKWALAALVHCVLAHRYRKTAKTPLWEKDPRNVTASLSLTAGSIVNYNGFYVYARTTNNPFKSSDSNLSLSNPSNSNPHSPCPSLSSSWSV